MSVKKDKIDKLLSQMTLAEKVGQLNLLVGDIVFTGPRALVQDQRQHDELIVKGEVTGLFNVYGTAYTERLQHLAVEESRLGIPLLFGADIIHGLKTIFPIPLAEAATWNEEAIEQSARIAAQEATAAGLNWTFAPMVDISRDPRWGRIAEGAGEDPYWASLVAAARVRGFQGENLSDPDTMAACVKHFAGYGAAEGGRDYNTVDLSQQRLRELYLPPFQAAIRAGAASLMTGFNELNGIPATAHPLLLQQILNEEWDWEGVVVSDWQSIGEMQVHGYAANLKEAALLALQAGVDMDMMSKAYHTHLPTLLEEEQIGQELLDQAVRRVLELKYDLGLFDNPFQYGTLERERMELRQEEHLEAAREIARESIVLLRNEEECLPLKKEVQKIALIGPLATDQDEHNGTWSFFAEATDVVSIEEGLRNALPAGTEIQTVRGCGFYATPDYQPDFQEALAAAKNADTVILALGESAVMNGEAASRTQLGLPGFQQDLLDALAETDSRIVLLVFAGRPLVLTPMVTQVHALLYCWTLGSETGNAVADVLTGAYNPSGRLPLSFPRAEGQIPIYYNHKSTGRPYDGNYADPAEERLFLSKYRDERNEPLFPFGYGLTYTSFYYTEVSLSAAELAPGDRLEVEITLTNNGLVAGEEVVQLYVWDENASVTQPVKKLRKYEKVALEADESREVIFVLTPEDLSFVDAEGQQRLEPGWFTVYVGSDAHTSNAARFRLLSESEE